MKQKSYPPKDGGWGWLVVFGAAIYAFLTRGFLRSFSLLFEEIRHKFGTSASSTAWIYSVMVTTSLFAGPVSAMLSTRFSVRKVGLFGSCLVCVGFLASAFSPSLIYLYLAFALGGFGQGLIDTPSLIIIGEWFDKRRARATSFALMTDGVGMLALGPLLQYLPSNYGYSGTMLIMSAIMAHHFVAVALFRQPDKLDYANEHDEEVKECLTIEKECLHEREKDDIDMTGILPDVSMSNGTIEIKNCKVDEESVTIAQAMPDNGNTEILIESSSLCQEDSICSKADDSVQNGCSEKITKYFDYRLLSMGHYLTFCFFMLSAALCLSMGNTHIAGLAIETGLDAAQVTILFTLLGSLSIASKFLSGFLFDIPAVRKVRVHVFTSFGIVVGSCLLVSPFIDNIIGFYMVWVVYASAVGVILTQESIIIADIIGREKFSSALGISRFFRGLGVLIGPTFGGFLKDYTEVYDYTFIFGGLCFISSVVLFEIAVIIVNRRNK